MEPKQAIILDGKVVSQLALKKAKEELKTLHEQKIYPKLSIILIGNNPASVSYIRQKKKFCEKTGILENQINFPETITEEALLNKIYELNNDKSVHGILVQLPIPTHINDQKIIEAINPAKDVDGFHAYNIGRMFLKKEFENLAPCTPNGILKILEHYNINVEGKEVVVIGRSNIVGKPISIMLINRGATVTTCNSKTKNLKSHTLRADILIVAIGKAHFVTADTIKEGAVVIDVGVNRIKDDNSKTGFKLVGDVDFEKAVKKASAITPVPGGCGPMTVTCLIENTIKAAQLVH